MTAPDPASWKTATRDVHAAPPGDTAESGRMCIGVRGRRYPCPDLAALDQHLLMLCEQLRRAGGLAGVTAAHRATTVHVIRQDIDILLDMRLIMRGQP